MKKPNFAIFLILCVFISCKKEESAPVTTTSSDTYMSYSANSTWNYEVTDNIAGDSTGYVVTSTNSDTILNGKKYHIFTNSSDTANEFYNVTGNDYYTFQGLPAALGGSTEENLYLKDNAAVNAAWSQQYPISASGVSFIVNVTNTITEKGISKTVNGTVYNDVIHVTTSIAVSVFGTPLPAGAITTDIENYYAKQVGMIQSKNKISINYLGITNNVDEETYLKQAVIK